MKFTHCSVNKTQEMERIVSSRGHTNIVFKNYKFRKVGGLTSGYRWRCTVGTCKAYIHTDESETLLLNDEAVHNHEPSEKLARYITASAVKRKATEDMSERPRKIIVKEICSANQGMSLTVHDMELLRRSIYRIRRKEQPVLPKTVGEIHDTLRKMNISTAHGENFLLYNDSEKNIVCFATEKNLKFAGNCTTVFVDGTFTYCPKYFYQLFTILVHENGHYIPVIFFLLPNKKTVTYEAAFSCVTSECLAKGIRFTPKTIVVDFEDSIHEAARKVWPEISVIGCRFHLTQAWWRKIQQLGLSQVYMDHTSEPGQWLNSIFGLPLLDAEEVEDAFVEDFMSSKPAGQKITKFCDYLTETYIMPEARYPPVCWASSRLSSLRTTNACESFHSHFGAYFYSPHPNIFVFLNALRQKQVETEISINSVSMKKCPSNVQYRKWMESMKRLQLDYKQGKISRNHYTKCAAFHYKKQTKS